MGNVSSWYAPLPPSPSPIKGGGESPPSLRFPSPACGGRARDGGAARRAVACHGSLFSRSFLLLLFTFFCNTLLWAMIMQPGHPPDEWLHFDYVRHLFLHHTLPVYGETRYIFNPELLQAHAMLPPLYYALGVPLLALAGDQPVAVQVVVVRMLSVIISTGTVTVAYALGRVLIPARPRFALAFAALVGFNPMFTYMSAAINSDNLVNLIAAALLLLLVYGLRQAQYARQDHPQAALWSPSRRWMIGMGALMGIGLLTKPTIAIAVLGCGVILVWMAWQSPGSPIQRLRLLVVMGAWIGGVALVISGWNFARNWYLYGDPVGVSLVGSQAGSYVPRPYAAIGSFGEMLLATREFDPLLPMLFQSFWGYFDHLQLLMPSRLLIVLAILTAGGIGGTLVWLLRHWQQGSGECWQRASVVAGAVFIVLTVGSVLYACYRVDYQPQGRYLYTALLPLMLMIVVGWGQLAGMLRIPSLIAPLLLATIVVVNMAALVTTVAPGHHYRAVRQQAGQGQYPVPLAHTPPASSPTIAFGPFAAQYPFVPNSANVAQLDMVLDMSPGVHGPLIWRIADGQQHEVAHGVAEQVPRKLTRYTLVMPPELRFNAGHPYTLTVHAPWANADKPLRAYAATPANASDPTVSSHRLLVLHIGYADKPLEMGIYRLSRHLLTAPPQSAWGIAQLVLYVVVGLLMLALVLQEVASTRFGIPVASIGVVILAVLLMTSEPTMALPHEQVQAKTGQLLRLGEQSSKDKSIVADLLLLADSPATVKYPPDDTVNKVSHIQPITFVLSDTPDPVLFMHPTSAITYTLDIPTNAHLETAITLNPLVWEHSEGGEESDGATFVVMVQEAGGRKYELMRRFIDPRHNETDRQWYAVSLDLGAYATQRVHLVLMVLPGPSGHAMFDWAGWRQPMVR